MVLKLASGTVCERKIERKMLVIDDKHTHIHSEPERHVSMIRLCPKKHIRGRRSQDQEKTLLK